MKIGDLIYIFYESGSAKFIVKIEKIENNPTYPHKFSIFGKVIWNNISSNMKDKWHRERSGFFSFQKYGVYNGNTPIKDILMIEEL